MDNINAQTCERLRLRAPSLLPLGLVSSSSSTAGSTTTLTALRGGGSGSSSRYIRYFSRESNELIYEVFRTEMAVKLFVRPAGRP